MRVFSNFNKVILLTKSQFKFNKHICFDNCTSLFIKDCDEEYLSNNVSFLSFPQLQNIAVKDNDWDNKYLYMKYLSEINGWKTIDYDMIKQYKFEFIRGNAYAGN